MVNACAFESQDPGSSPGPPTLFLCKIGFFCKEQHPVEPLLPVLVLTVSPDNVLQSVRQPWSRFIATFAPYKG